jgi:deoxycytidylate deaminase
MTRISSAYKQNANLNTMQTSRIQDGPELFLGLAAAVGTNLDRVIRKLAEALEEVDYEAHAIRLASLMSELPDYRAGLIREPVDKYIDSHMTQGNELRRRTARNDAMVILGIAEIKRMRWEAGGSGMKPHGRHAYILRSLKHPDEVSALRKIYGNAFYLIAAYAPRDKRRDHLAQRIARSRNETQASKHFPEAERLILRDQEELGLGHGQNLRDTYHRADVFIDTTDEETLTRSISRFVELIFGNTLHTPSRSEYVMFHAKAAALRSAELGRQVGAAISRANGDIVAVGTNEVPRAGGGLYWCDDSPDMREFMRGSDSSDENKLNLIADTLRQLNEQGWLVLSKRSRSGVELAKDVISGESPVLSSQSMIRNVIEYGRAVHAEMAAIVDAARRGVGISDCIMYVTAFPCHLCARHIVASGIRKVVYIEPYPKSLAAELYPDSIKVEGDAHCSDQVIFEPFVGVSPRQYMQLFEASARKDKDGKAVLFDASKADLRYRASERLYLEDEDALMRTLSATLSRQGSLFGGENA